MTEKKKEKKTVKNKKEIGMKVEEEYFTPALREAARKAADENFDAKDIINGAANAYMKMIITLSGGVEPASRLFHSQADHLENLSKKES